MFVYVNAGVMLAESMVDRRSTHSSHDDNFSFSRTKPRGFYLKSTQVNILTVA